MRIRNVLLVATGMFVLATMAHAAPQAVASSASSDSWAKPASAATLPRSRVALPGRATTASPFKFKQRSEQGPADQPPPSANDKAAVMGTERPWQNGRPPVDCAQTPRDPACQH
jgi:hypothetical protein